MLPNGQTMRALHNKTIEERGGYGKHVMFLGPERGAGMSVLPCPVLILSILTAITAYLMGWLNEAAVKYGGKQVRGARCWDGPILTTLAKIDGNPKE